MKRFNYGLGYYKLLTGNIGKLYPVGLTEVLPGDSIRHHSNVLCRLLPLARPVMHPIQMNIVHYFVPHRLAWDGWEDFITGGPGLADTNQIPQVTVPASAAKTLFDYYGVNPVEGVSVSSLPFLGFARIWNEFFRDQDLQTERLPTDYTIPNISWSKDYFTTARPWEQKGEAITVPLGDTAPVKTVNADGRFRLNRPSGSSVATQTDPSGNLTVPGSLNEPISWPDDQYVADLANADQVPINTFRRAFALQRFAEARARYGSRYAEFLRYYGVRNRDARLQRPQMLGGGRQTISISEVLKTGEVSETVDPQGRPLADLAGHGIGMMKSNRYQRFFEEHGYIHTLLYLRPKTMYTQSIHRTWLRKDREDFFQKELTYIGQQPVLLNELYASAANGSNVFGWSDRYRDYRENPSGVAGEFRTTAQDWHLGRVFDAEPALNDDFLQIKEAEIQRIFAEQTQDNLRIMVNHKMQARRMVPKSAAGRII